MQSGQGEQPVSGRLRICLRSPELWGGRISLRTSVRRHAHRWSTWLKVSSYSDAG